MIRLALMAVLALAPVFAVVAEDAAAPTTEATTETAPEAAAEEVKA